MADGILIAIEGVDGAGKTTQKELLCEAFRKSSESVVCSKEPTDGPWGKKIRESASTGRLSVEEELEAFENDRRQHVRELIQPALDGGKIVILDRYFYSNVAYQGSSGANPSEILQRMKAFAPIPDIVLFVDIPVELGIVRISDGRNETPNEFEQPEFLGKCKDVFHRLAETETNFTRIDGTQGIAHVHHQILDAVFNGPIKSKRCRKDSDCDGLHCSLGEGGDCRYAELRKKMSIAGL